VIVINWPMLKSFFSDKAKIYISFLYCHFCAYKSKRCTLGMVEGVLKNNLVLTLTYHKIFFMLYIFMNLEKTFFRLKKQNHKQSYTVTVVHGSLIRLAKFVILKKICVEKYVSFLSVTRLKMFYNM
jgi:hypothetical protein